MDIPPDVAIDGLIQKGSVYYFTNDKFASTEPHYHIVLNKDPLNDEIILLAVSSSQIENVKRINRNNPPETIVEISHSEYSEFSKDSIIDCNSPIISDKSELRNKYQIGKLKLKGIMDSDLVDSLINGVLNSRTVVNSIKNILKQN